MKVNKIVSFMELGELKKVMLDNNASEEMIIALNSINKQPQRPLGKFSPWAWCLEPVRGCNLSCWHCPVALFPKDVYSYMTKETWVNTWKLIREVSPRTRVEMANLGEPILHPDILEFISIARKISPRSQIQVTTNGTQLIKGNITYKELFDAGTNVVYVDMYSPEHTHEALAKESGYEYYKYYEKNSDVPGAFTYHNNPSIKFIALTRTPENWPKAKIGRGALGTFLNELDWDKAGKFISPVESAPNRMCNQPMKYVQVGHDGTYFFCCQDAFNQAGIIENTNNGIEDFMKFWFGHYMQSTRKVLHTKNRNGHNLCGKCSIIFSRCDMKLWDEKLFDYHWDGEELNVT